MTEVTPELMAFSDKAKVKWKIEPGTNDIRALSTSMGALADYMAFFESHGTRLTEYYVDVLKIQDAIVHIEWEAGQKDALDRLHKERKELEAKKAAGGGANIDQELDRNQKALDTLEKTKPQTASTAKDGQKPPYTLSDEEDRPRAQEEGGHPGGLQERWLREGQGRGRRVTWSDALGTGGLCSRSR